MSIQAAIAFRSSNHHFGETGQDCGKHGFQ
jgi:hypothetical protein